MRAVTDFLLPELLKLLLDAPPVDPYASEESESQSQSQSQSQSESQARGNGGVNAAALPQTQPRVMIVRDTNPPAQTITVVDRSFAIDAFLPQQVIAAQVLEKYDFARLSALRGSLIRIEKYHFSTPQRCEAARTKQLMSREQARVCLWVDEISVIDATSSLSVNSMPHIDENARIAALLQELSDDQLNMRLTVRQRLLPLSNTPHGVEQFDDNHPLKDDDCIIPEDQEAQLEAQDGWGVSTAKQKSDSQLIAENGSEPESQGLGTQLSPALLSKAASVRVEATEQPQEDGDESVSDSQGFHFQEENIEKAFVQCSDSESDDESSNSSSDHDGAREGATVKSSQSARTATKTTEAAAQGQSERSSSKDIAVKRRSPFKMKKKARPSQQSSQSDADVTREATEKLIGVSQEEAAITDPIGGDSFPQTQAQDSREGFADADDSTTDPNESQTQMSQEAGTQGGNATYQVRVTVMNSVLRTLTHGKEASAFDEADQEREAEHLSQQPNSLDNQSQSASSSILFNAADLQHEFLTQAPDADSQNEPNTTEREDDDEGQTEGGNSFLPMDVDVWHTQPNEESQVFGFESFGNLNSQSQNEHEDGGRPISSFVNAEPADSLQRIEETSEVPEFGVGESFADEQENRELQHHNQSQPKSDNHQQSVNLLSPKVASKQQARDSPRPKASLQSDEIPTKSRGRSGPGTPASSKPSSIPDGLSQVDLTRSGKASPSSTGLSSQKHSQKRSLGSMTSSGSGDPQSTTAAADAGANSSSSVMRQRKALRRTENSSPHQSSKGKAPVPPSAAVEKTNRNSFFDGVPLSILQRAYQLQDEPSATTSRNSNLSSSGSGGEPRSLRTVLDQLSQLQHDASQRPTGISSQRRDISSSSSTTSQPHVRPSKRYEHMFPPFRMDDLNKMILKKFVPVQVLDVKASLFPCAGSFSGAMDSILERLWTLANDDVEAFSQSAVSSTRVHLKEELVAEAQALWRTLETLLATLRTQDLNVGNPAFVKLLSCIRTVRSDPEYWHVHAVDKHGKGVYVYVNRVIVKLGCRGEREREALVRDGLVELLVASMRDQCDSTIAAESMIQVLQTLAFDAKNRQTLDAAETMPFCLSLMKNHPRDVHVQVFGCKFLQLMVYEEDCKEKMTRYGTMYVVLDALRRFPNDPQLSASALDLIYFLSMELESAMPTEKEFLSMMEEIVESVTKTMHVHNQVEQVQTNGLAALNCFVSNAQAKRVMCTKSIWELVLGALDHCSDGEGDATTDAIDFLEALLSDPITFDTVEYTLKAPSINDRTKSGTIQTLKALKAKLESMRSVEKKQSEVLYITSRLQYLIDPRNPSNFTDSTLRAEAQSIQANRLLPPPESDFRVSQQQTSGNRSNSRYVLREDDESEIPLVAIAETLHHYSPTRTADTETTNPAAAPNTLDDEYAEAHDFGDDDIKLNRGNSVCNNTVQDLALLESNSSRFLDDLALDSDAGGYFEKFLRDVDKKFNPSHAASEQKVLTTPNHSSPHFPRAQSVEEHAVESVLSTTASKESAKSRSPGTDVAREHHHQLQQQQTNPVDAMRSFHPTSGGIENSSGHQSRHSGSSTRSSSNNNTWRELYESSSEEIKALKAEYHNLNENFKIVSRRAKEQSKLLNLQNSRIKNHMEVHQQVLDQVHSLEEVLAEANCKYQVERELRNAEVAQSEKISMALHEATKEIKALNSQNSSASRELMHKEKLRVDYQQKTSEIKHLKEKIELERDDAVIQAQMIRFEKIELCRQLDDCRREGIEALLMREDADAPKLRVFSEIWRSSMPSPSRSSTRGRVVASFTGKQAGGIDQSRRSSTCSPFAVQPIDTSSRPFSTYGGRGSPRKASIFGSLETSDANADPETVEREDIESSLKTIYESMDTSLDGSGVHIATVRRFFLESGVVQTPIVAADVDVILSKVLTQAQENRRKVVVRKDYAFAQAAPPSQANEAKKFRYFDQDSFNEALTLVGMKRFPRFDVKRVLQTIVAEYLHPIQRRMRANSMLQACVTSASGHSATMANSASSFSSSSGRRSSSMYSINGGGGASFCGSPGASSPSSVCSAVMRAILNGLALHIGHDKEEQRLPGTDSNDDARSHHSSTSERSRTHKREEVVYSMLEMHSILAREQKPLGTICEFYSAIHHHQNTLARDELLGISFELLLNFAMDFEIIPSFMDRVSLKHLYSEVSGFIKAYLSMHKKFPHATDTETLKKVAFSMVLARVAIELFSAKVDYETPEKQITGLLQWLDNSAGREKSMRKTTLPLVIKFSRKLYVLKM